MADKHPGFIRGSEAHLAAVWYVMKEAEASYEKNRGRIESGHQNPWGFLNRVRRALGLPERRVPYSVMREDLLRFAETFGVEGLHPASPNDRRNNDAVKEFS